MFFREFASRGVNAVSLRPRADIVDRCEVRFTRVIETSRAGYGVPGRERSRNALQNGLQSVAARKIRSCVFEYQGFATLLPAYVRRSNGLKSVLPASAP